MWDFSIFLHADAWLALVTLTLMEVVLGIDNIVFITIVTDQLPVEKRSFARRVGLGLALGSRLALLFAISWMMGMNEPLFTVADYPVTLHALVVGIGGLFLIAKATSEIFEKMELRDGGERRSKASSMASVLVQITVLDIVFSLDSVITAVGMADQLLVMVIAMVIAVATMLVFADRIGDFVSDHPSMAVLALAFLLLIGVMLVAESLGQHINKGYIYFAMGFSLLVELINMRLRKSEGGAAEPTA